MMMLLSLWGLVVVPAVHGLGYFEAGTPELVSTQVLAMVINPFWETFPNGYSSIQGLGSLPVDAALIYYFRIKEYADGSTTMDLAATGAGALHIITGETSFFGLSAEELYERVPVTRDFDKYIADPPVAGVSNWQGNVTIDLFWDEHVIKRDVTWNGVAGQTYNAYSRSRATGNTNRLYPSIEIGVVTDPPGEVHYLDNNYVTLFKDSSDGSFTIWDYGNVVAHATEHDYLFAYPEALKEYHSNNDAFMEWYISGNGSETGGLGNPPLVVIDETIVQTYI